MSAITQKLFEMIENADPFYDEFWDEVLSENVNEFVANFSNQDWMDVVSILPAGKREKDYCLLETILDNCNDDRIVTSAIEKMVNLICQDEDMLWMIFMQGKILKLHLSKDVKTKLEKACSERINSLNKNIQLPYIRQAD